MLGLCGDLTVFVGVLGTRRNWYEVDGRNGEEGVKEGDDRGVNGEPYKEKGTDISCEGERSF